MALRCRVILLFIFLLYQVKTSNGFFWKDCSAEHDPVTFKKISIQPDPIEVPGQFSYKGTVYFNESLSSMTGDMKLYKRLIFWWRIPCLNLFKCHFDACELTHHVSQCQFNSGANSSSEETQYFPLPSIPFFSLSGHYSATIILKSNEKQVGCVDVYFTVDTPSFSQEMTENQ